MNFFIGLLVGLLIWGLYANRKALIRTVECHLHVKQPCGFSAKEAMEWLENDTHCGIYWNCKAEYHPNTNTVSIHMEGNEHVEVDLNTGKRVRTDLDY